MTRPDRVVHGSLSINGAGRLTVGPWLIVGSDSAPLSHSRSSEVVEVSK